MRIGLGLYAKDAPIDLADRMQAALEDPTFGTVVSELQLLRAKIAEITSAPSGMTAREFRVVLTVVDRIDRLFRTQMKRGPHARAAAHARRIRNAREGVGANGGDRHDGSRRPARTSP